MLFLWILTKYFVTYPQWLEGAVRINMWVGLGISGLFLLRYIIGGPYERGDIRPDQLTREDWSQLTLDDAADMWYLLSTLSFFIFGALGAVLSYLKLKADMRRYF